MGDWDKQTQTLQRCAWDKPQQPAGAQAPRVLVLCGPTATGKTALSVALAKRLDGEVVCADSMQLYKGLVVGTAQATPEEMQGVPHHLVGFLPPEQEFSVAEYVRAARACIADTTARGKLPIVVGGTGLYVQSLMQGVAFVPQEVDMVLREALRSRLAAEGIAPLYAQLQALDPVCAAALHPNNHGRVLRALEVCLSTGETMSQHRARSVPVQRPYRDTVAALYFENRTELYARIDARVLHMLRRGLLGEAELVYTHQERYRTAAQAIGYKEFFPYFKGEQPLETCVQSLQQASRNYAKRQLTWLRRMQGVSWLQADSSDLVQRVCDLPGAPTGA